MITIQILLTPGILINYHDIIHLLACETLTAKWKSKVSYSLLLCCCSRPSFRKPRGLGHCHLGREEGNPTERFVFREWKKHWTSFSLRNRSRSPYRLILAQFWANLFVWNLTTAEVYATQNFTKDYCSGIKVYSPVNFAIFLVKAVLMLWLSPFSHKHSTPRAPTWKYQLNCWRQSQLSEFGDVNFFTQHCLPDFFGKSKSEPCACVTLNSARLPSSVINVY